MLDRGLRRRVPARRRARGARGAALEARRRATSGRRDLRDLPTFTIDPSTAKDFDDAISAEALDDATAGGSGCTSPTSARSSAPARPSTARPTAAARRSTCPAAVEPMLPEVLSNGACSLVPGAGAPRGHRRARPGTAPTVTRAAFYRSRIRSDERLDYDQVDRIFAGDERRRRAVGGAAGGRARGGARAARAPRGARRAGGRDRRAGVHLRRAGPRGRAEPRCRRSPTSLIEHLMIAANEAVARLLYEREVPTLYRIHERPEPAAAERLLEQLDVARRADAAGPRAHRAAARRARSSPPRRALVAEPTCAAAAGAAASG